MELSNGILVPSIIIEVVYNALLRWVFPVKILQQFIGIASLIAIFLHNQRVPRVFRGGESKYEVKKPF